MVKISVLLVVCVFLAYMSELRTVEMHSRGFRYRGRHDPAWLLMVLILILFSGLRVAFNDTQNYIRGYQQAVSLEALLSDPDSLNPLKNPLFYIFQSVLKDLGANVQVMIFVTSAFTQTCIMLFLKRYSSNYVFSTFLYFTLGTFNLTLAALKQVLAIAILTLAFPYMEKRKWVQYYLLVLIAMLVHTYAISFVFLPLFTQRPWQLFTFLFAAALIILMLNFETAITDFLDQAQELGKQIADYEVFDNQGINIFRLGVYAVVPLISFLFRRWIFVEASPTDHVLVHMSIISLAFMVMGTQSGANMFGRMANYFELGTICCLPWMLEKTFERRSYRLIATIAVICFLGFFIYANGVNMIFDQEYQATSFLSLFTSD